MSSQPIECLGVVLAGGLSSRMGQDKSKLFRSKNANMLDYSKKLLVNAGIKDIIVSGDNHQVPDLVTESGPVGGIYSVVSHYLTHLPVHMQPKALLIIPVDLPLMTASELQTLRLKGELSNKATFFNGGDNRAHHIPLYLPNNHYLALFLQKAFIGKRLNNNQNNNKSNKNAPSVRGMLESIPHQAINSQNTNALFNTNTPEQWQQAKINF